MIDTALAAASVSDPKWALSTRARGISLALDCPNSTFRLEAKFPRVSLFTV